LTKIFTKNGFYGNIFVANDLNLSLLDLEFATLVTVV